MKLLDAKIDRLQTDMTEVKVDLREHMRRTASNEENIALLRADFSPIKTHVAVSGAMTKGIAVAGSVVGLVTGVLKLLGKI